MISLLKRDGPVTLVRSPLLTKLPLASTVICSHRSSGRVDHRLDTGTLHPPRDLGDGARREVAHGLTDRLNVRGSGSAAAADDIDYALLRPVADLCRGCLGALVIFAKIVRKARIGIGHDQGVGDS